MPKRLAILYDCPYPFVQGGGQKRLFEIAQYLLKHDWEVEWYALKFWEGPDSLKSEGITYTAVGKQVELYDSNGKRRVWETLYYGAMIVPHVELRRFDILLAGQWPLFHLIPARIFCLLGKSKLVIDWWEVWGQDHWINYFGLKGIFGLCLEKLLSRITPHIIAITQKGKKQLQSLGAKEDDIIFIPNGIDFEKILRATTKSKEFDLVYMGRLQSHKNIADILQAVALLKGKGCSVKLQIIGGGPEKNNLEELVSTLKIDDEVFFHGEIESDEEAYAWMKASRFFVYPSTKGSGSISVLEANACGLPVIAYKTDQGMAEELIEEGVNGYWADSPTPEALANKIFQVFTGSSFNQGMFAQSQQRAKWIDRWDKIEGDYRKIKVIEKKKKRFDLVYMGRLKGHKNVDHLLQAVALLTKMGDFVTLQVIGGGPELKKLKALVQTLNIADNVVFHGEISSDSEAYSWMKASRFFIHPSTKEGGGSITVLEANACGLPVVAYRHKNGIADELIDEGINGYWVEEVSPKALAIKIRQLLLDKSLDKNIKGDSIKYARRYDWQNIAKEYDDFFSGIMAGGRQL